MTFDVYTIGFSNRTWDDTLSILRTFEIGRLVDIRTSPEPIQLISERRTVYACTEAVFWRCHRQLVSNALVVRGYHVGNIFNVSKVETHKPTEFVKAHGLAVTYPSLL